MELIQRNNFITCIMAAGVIAISLFLGFQAGYAVDRNEIVKTILLITAPILVIYVLSSERTWIPILICLALIRDLSLGNIMGGGSVKIGDIFIFVVFSVWIIRSLLINKNVVLFRTNLDIALVLFLIVHSLSLFWSTDMDFGIVRNLKLLRNFCFFLIIRDLFINDFVGSYKRLVFSFILTGLVLLIVHAGVVISLGGISEFQTLFQQDILESRNMGVFRTRGTGAGILISGSSAWFIITGTLVFGSLMLAKAKNIKILITMLIILMFGAATLTLSRTAIITVAITLAVLFYGSVRFKLKENKKILLAMLVIFAIIGVYSGMNQILYKRLDNMFMDLSWSEREELYAAAIDAFYHSPLIGIGAGSNYSWQLNYDFGYNVSRIVHSLYLLILSETGLLGFIIFMGIVILWLKYLWSCMRSFNIEPFVKSICLCLMAFSVSFLIYSFTVGEFENFEPWLVMGIASAVKVLYLTPKNSNGECYA